MKLLRCLPVMVIGQHFFDDCKYLLVVLVVIECCMCPGDKCHVNQSSIEDLYRACMQLLSARGGAG